MRKNSYTLDAPVNTLIFVRPRCNCLVLGYFDFFLNLELLINCYFFWTLSPHTSYINIRHKHTRLWWKGCWFRTICELLANVWYFSGLNCDETQNHSARQQHVCELWSSRETMSCGGLYPDYPKNCPYFLWLQKYRIWLLEYSRLHWELSL